jgi:large conductance mechanosensitive channel
MGLLQEFKSFALRGNVVDMAVGLIIGGAFQTIVKSAVNDVMMPPLGWAVSKIKDLLTATTGQAVNFKDLFVTLGDVPPEVNPNSYEAVQKAGVAALGYGAFLQTVLDFTIMAFCVFMAIKVMNAAIKKQEAPKPPAEPPPDVKLLTEIRDLLAKRT